MKNICAKKIGAQTLTFWARQNLQLLTSSKSVWRALVQVMLSLLYAVLKWGLHPGRPDYMGGVSCRTVPHENHTLGLFKEIGKDGPAQLVDVSVTKGQGHSRQLRAAQRARWTPRWRWGSPGPTASQGTLATFTWARMNVEAHWLELDGCECNTPVAAPPLHELQEGWCILATVVDELLLRWIVFRLSSMADELQDLDAPLEQVPLLVRPRSSNLLVIAGEVVQGELHDWNKGFLRHCHRT